MYKHAILINAAHDRIGIPSNWSLGSALNAGLISCALIHWPSDSKKMTPLKMVNVPSVTTIGGMSSFHTNSPLILPSKAPSTIASTTNKGIGIAGAVALSMAVHMPTSARLAAMDRSMQRVRMTAICPSARIISIDVSLKTLDSDLMDANCGKRRYTRAISATSANANRASREAVRRIMRRWFLQCRQLPLPMLQVLRLHGQSQPLGAPRA